MTLYRWATDLEEADNRHTSPKGWLRFYDDDVDLLGLLVPVGPTATWFTIEDADDERFCELWALGKVKPVPLDGNDER